MKDYDEADRNSPETCTGPHARAGAHAIKDAATHKEPQKKKLLAGTAACGQEPPKEQVFWQELQPVGDSSWSSLLLKNCTPWKGPMLTQFLKELQPTEGTVKYG